MKIYNEQYIRGRIYSFVRFQKYLREISEIFCEEFDLDKNEIIDISITDDSKTVMVHFIDGSVGFDSEILWDQNARETFKKLYEVN